MMDAHDLGRLLLADGDEDDMYTKLQNFWPTSTAGLAISGVCASIATLVSLIQISQHIMNYEDPVIQRYYIRIIFLIPNYALCSFFSLVFPGAALYIETVRDIYEAFVIYMFMSLLLEYIGGPGQVEQFSREKVVHGSLLYGTCCFPPMQVDGQFVKLCKRCVLQFVVLKPILAILTIVLYSQGLYDEGEWSLSSAYTYIEIVYNICYALALIGLIHFWVGTQEQLKPYKPILKFVTVKLVVFITFWQGLAISIFLTHLSSFEAKQAQNWLLCVEMIPAAAAMWLAFPTGQYTHAAGRRQGGIMMAVRNVGNVVMFTDVVTDFKHQFVPTYSTYTCYASDFNPDDPDTTKPTGRFRHATYVVKDFNQEDMIAQHQGRAASSAAPAQQTMRAATEPAPGAQTGRNEEAVGVADLLGEFDDVPLDDGNSSAPVHFGQGARHNVTDINLL